MPARALAASLALAIAAALMITESPTDRAAPDQAMDRVPSGSRGSAPTWAATLSATEREYRTALLAFTPVTGAAPLVGEQAAGAIQGSWMEMQAAENQLLEALAAHPDHRLLAAQLIDLRARQLDLLRRLHRLGHDRLKPGAAKEQSIRRST